MADIDSLRVSIPKMSDQELMARLLEIRSGRRPKSAESRSRVDVSKLGKVTAAALLKILERSIGDGSGDEGESAGEDSNQGSVS